MIKFLNKHTQKMSAAMVTGMVMGNISGASAQDLNNYLSESSEKVNNIPQLVTFVSYLGGTALAALGILGLKNHVENPSQEPMKNGLAKLGFGGMLLALPTIVSVMQGTGEGSSAGAAMMDNPLVSF